MKALLKDRPRDLALLTLGINSAFRAGDILAIERSDLIELPDGRFRVSVRESKTGKVRTVELNSQTSAALAKHLATSSGRFVFEGQRGRLTVSAVARMLKKWAAEVGVTERVATHTMRKTFARQHLDRGAKITTLMHVLNHSSERQTLAYLGIVAEDVAALYADAI